MGGEREREKGGKEGKASRTLRISLEFAEPSLRDATRESALLFHSVATTIDIYQAILIQQRKCTLIPVTSC